MEQVFRDLLAFEKECGHKLPVVEPGHEAYSSDLIQLRMSLITEEYKETIDALGKAKTEYADFQDTVCPHVLAEIADGLADLIYVCVGTAVRLGIDLPEVWRRVQAANMSKFGEGSWVDETGKRRKPPGFKPPDILGVIESQRPLSDIYGDMAK